jgi:hypothetical protein
MKALLTNCKDFFQNHHAAGWGVVIVTFLFIAIIIEWRMSVNAKNK